MSKRRARAPPHRTARQGGIAPAVLDGPGATQPFNRVVWPWEAIAGMPLVWDSISAARLPSVARAVSIYSGQIRQAPMDDYKGIAPLTRPPLLDQPDPAQPGSAWFVGCQVEDYLYNGNAVHYVTARDATTGWPTACTWIPAAWITIACPPRRYDKPTYMLNGDELPAANVVHVKRSADRWCPARGVGVVEQHVATLDRVAMQEQYERNNLSEGAVPSAAVITPNPRLGQNEADTAKIEWLEKFVGPGRKPAILPAGTQIVPLGWSPADSQLDEARKLALVDVANLFNLDPYWLGGPTSSLTYRSPGPMYTHLLRISLGPVITDFEQTWSQAWLPRGRRVVFDREVLQRDDVASTVHMLAEAVAAGLMSIDEARAYLKLPASPAGATVTSPVDTEVTP